MRLVDVVVLADEPGELLPGPLTEPVSNQRFLGPRLERDRHRLADDGADAGLAQPLDQRAEGRLERRRTSDHSVSFAA